jgi:hypothetical protein
VKRVFLLLVLVVLVVGASVPLTQIRDAKQAEARLGYFPPAPVIKALVADQYQFMSQVITLECLFYFGGLLEEKRQVPEWQRIYQALLTSTRLDPYNMDAYYFAQAVLTWEPHMIPRLVELLEYGFAHRPWDWYLPFFLSEIKWYSTLAARYFYEGGSTALALAYLKEMIPTARNEAIKKRMITRAEAFEKILRIEKAVLAYTNRFQTEPKKIEDLVEAGLLERIPQDPYGGYFYLDKQGKVRTTSKLAHGVASHGTHKN